MKMKNTFLVFVLAGMCLASPVTSVHGGSVLRLELVDSPPIYSGSTFEVQVLADVGTYEIVAFGFDVVWESMDVTFDLAVVAPPFVDTSLSFPDTDVAGGIDPFQGAASGDDVLLATLSFAALNAGMTSVGIFSNLSDLSELNEGLFFPCPTPRIDMTTSLEISVSEIPLPPALLLLGSGLAALALIRRKE